MAIGSTVAAQQIDTSPLYGSSEQAGKSSLLMAGLLSRDADGTHILDDQVIHPCLHQLEILVQRMPTRGWTMDAMLVMM